MLTLKCQRLISYILYNSLEKVDAKNLEKAFTISMLVDNVAPLHQT